MMRREHLKTVLKFAVSTLLITLLICSADIDTLKTQLSGVAASAIVAAVLIVLALSPIHALRWKIIIRAYGGNLPFRQALQIVLVGYFFNQVLPSSVGGDVMRVWRAHRAGLSVADAMNTVILDRMAALLSLIVITLVGWPWLRDVIREPIAFSALSLVMVGVAGAIFVLALLDRMPKTLLRWRVARGLSQLSAGTRAVFLVPRFALPAIGLSVVTQLAGGLILYVLARGIDANFGIIECLLLAPAVNLFAMVPISIAGWGVREGATVVIFGYAGVPRDAALAVSILSGLAVLIAGLPGGIVWLVTGRHRTPSALPTDDSRK